MVLHRRRCRPTPEAFRAKLPSVIDIADSTRRLTLTTALVLGACFNEAGGNTGGEGTSNVDTTGSSSAPGSTSTATADTSSSDTGSADTTVATTDTGTTDGSSGDASTSTGEPVDPCPAALACDGGELLCESFEPPFALDRAPWAASEGRMAEPPSVTDQVAACGTHSISTAVDPNEEWYSQLGVTFPADELTTGPMRVRAKYWLEAPCFAGSAVRVLTLQFPSEFSGGIWYQFEATISPLELQLLSSDQLVGRVSRSAEIDFQPATWSELVLDFDMTTNPPTAVLALDGVAIGDGPIPSVNGALEQPASVLFGVYNFDLPFSEGCVAYVDDVVVEAL